MEIKDREAIILEIINLALKAGEEILKIYNTDFEVKTKEDLSPLTQADLISNSIINEGLQQTGIPIISEENKKIPYEKRKDWQIFWLVDPLDGTKEFVERIGQFTVNIALIRNRLPEIGVIYAPYMHLLYFGDISMGAYRIRNPRKEYKNFQDIAREVVQMPEIQNSPTIGVVASRSHYNEETKKFVEKLKVQHPDLELLNIGSSLKFGLLAEGRAHFYPRFAPTYEWDIAAGHAIIRSIGGTVMDYETKGELLYNKPSLINAWFLAYMLN